MDNDERQDFEETQAPDSRTISLRRHEGGSPEVASRGNLLGRTISHYCIQHNLGSGGMGEVYLANDLALGRRVALKLLPEGFNPDARDRLMREAWASAKVQHPSIATFHEAGEAAGLHFIAMEFVEGTNLREHLRRRTFSVEESILIASTILRGLAHAHASGIIHRDIKPENIVINDRGDAKLLDLGLAKGLLMEAPLTPDSAQNSESAAAGHKRSQDTTAEVTQILDLPLNRDADEIQGRRSSDLTQAGAILGTLGYMPPEQLRGEQVDERADIFAVGATLYEMLSGQRAYQADNLSDLIQKILHSDPPVLQGESIAPELAATVAKAMAPMPDDRHGSASDFLGDLLRFSGRDPLASDQIVLASVGFENATGRAEFDWVVAALMQGLLRRLSKHERFRIVPQERIMAARAAASRAQKLDPTELGIRLGCSWIMLGSLTRSGESLVASTRIVDVGTQHELASVSATGESDDVEELESRLFSDLATAIALPVDHESIPRIDSRAYELFARGWTLATTSEKANVTQALTLFERAVEIEPSFVNALAALAQQYGISNVFSSDATLIEKALAYADRAISIAPNYADPYVYKGYAYLHQGELIDAYISCRRAMELDPSNLLAHYFGAAAFLLTTSPIEVKILHEAASGEPTSDYHLWRRTQGVELVQRAIGLHRGFGWAWINLSWLHLDLGNFDEARWCAEQAIKLEPTTRPPTAGVRGFLGECYRRLGDLETAQSQFQAGLQTLESTDHIYRDLWRGLFLCMLGKVALQSGNRDAAHAAFLQSAQHIEGRARARCGGHVRVQALAGLAQVSGDAGHFQQALDLYENRVGYDFSRLFFTNDDYDLVALTKAARSLNKSELCERLFRRAAEHGANEGMY